MSALDLIQSLPDSTKVAREHALLGNYRTALAYFEDVSAQAEQYGKGVTDSRLRSHWTSSCQQVGMELRILKDLVNILSAFEEEPGSQAPPPPKTAEKRDPLVFAPPTPDPSARAAVRAQKDNLPAWAKNQHAARAEPRSAANRRVSQGVPSRPTVASRPQRQGVAAPSAARRVSSGGVGAGPQRGSRHAAGKREDKDAGQKRSEGEGNERHFERGRCKEDDIYFQETRNL